MAKPRTRPLTFQGQPAWIKYPEPARKNLFVGLHHLLAHIMPPALHPTNAPGGTLGLMQEADRLQSFAQAGLPVPAILERTKEHLILADCGPALRNHLRNLSDTQIQTQGFHNALEVLQAVHNAGFAHGRPDLRDFSISETGKISILDLEEDPLQSMPLATAQARDIWLFLCSVAGLAKTPLPLLQQLVNSYLVTAPPEVWNALRDLGRALRPYRRIISILRAQNLAKDIRRAYWASVAIDPL